MDYGFFLPARGPLATRESIQTLVRRAEDLGFAYLGVPDHIVIPRDIEPRYPYSESGEFPGGASGDCLDQLAVLAFIAGQTSSIRLLTSIMVMPHRSPVLAAKLLATIDVLSGGRLTVGCGVGWMREEFEAIGAPPFDERGRVGNEYLRVFKELWTAADPHFDGAYARFSDISFLPKPVQEPHPPIWIGGESVPAMKRAARLGDGWYPIGSNPNYPLDTAERYRAALDRLSAYAAEADRDLAEIDLGYAAMRWGNPAYGTARPGEGEEAEFLAGGERRILTGSPQQIAGDIEALRDAGVRHLIMNFQRPTPEETSDGMGRLADEVLPLVQD